jgi:myo-inositol 2-dehydrogenase/D-chiro-inositol 1-dehydrogenase
MMADDLGFGLIGAGAMGSIHAANLASGRIAGAALVAVADVVREAAEARATEHSLEVAYEKPEDLLADPRVDAVIIASPAITHGALIEQAAGAGKHVFVEKPFDISVEGSDRALAAVARAGVKLQVGFHRRLDASFSHARSSVAAGRIGEPYVIHITSRDPVWRVPPKIGGLSGLLFDTTIHDFDMARFVLGEVQSVYVVGTPAVHNAGVPDTLVAVLHFDSGALGTIENGQAVFGYDQRLEVFGSLGAVSVGNETPHTVTVVDREGSHAPLPHTFYPERYAAAYVAEIQSFGDCVRTGGDPAVTGADGRAATVIALAGQRSLDEGRPVAVEEIAGPA